MKTKLSFAVLAVALAAMTFIFSCDGCQKALDRFLEGALVDIPKEDRTPPRIWFEVTDAKTGETQVITSSTDISKNNGDVLDIVLWGEDADGGVKKLCLATGFSQECCTTSGSPTLCSVTQTSGANNCLDFSNMTTQAFKKWFIKNDLEVSLKCGTGFEFKSGSYGLVGTVENFHGGQASIGLGIGVK